MSVLSENPDNLMYSDLYKDIEIQYQYVNTYTVVGTEAQYVREVHTVYNEGIDNIRDRIHAKVESISLEDLIRDELTYQFHTYGVALQEITPQDRYMTDIAKMYVATMPMGRINDKPVTSALITVRKK